MRYIALLRGINVGGHTVKMERLRELFAALGLVNVQSYIQSGNVFFATEETDRATLTQDIERHLHQVLGYEVPTCLRTVDELERILALNPFANLDVTESMRLCVTFTPDAIPSNLVLPLCSPKQDVEIVHVTDHEAFVVWYLINGRPPTSAGWFDKTLGKRTTTRFFHTAVKILEAAKSG